jgi:uncharacterized protein YjiS (DUF1127 family)
MMTMSDSTADSQFNFRLPSLSYIDAKWEEPALRSSGASPRAVRNTGLAAWLSRQVAAFAAWRSDQAAASELSAMSDHELADIGLSRSDVPRVFEPAFGQDLYQRGAGF